MVKTISYIIDSKEESALQSICAILKIAPDLVFNDVNEFIKLKTYFLDSESDFKPNKGLGSGKINYLKKLYHRIIINDLPINNNGYYPDYLYSLAKSRYETLIERNFDRIIFEQFNVNVFVDFQKSWEYSFNKDSFNKHKEMIEDFLKRLEYAPNERWAKLEMTPANIKIINSTYEEMTKVRFRNLLFKMWSEIYKKPLKVISKCYFENNCELTQDEFISFYGINYNPSRSCEYCKISENEIAKLSDHEMIHTKRFYSRGISMEVDKRDPQKRYELGNLVMSCYWCNNAKTDEFTEEEYLMLGTKMSEIWRKRLAKIK